MTAPGPPSRPAAPGWYSDPWQQSALRWWDGGQWTHHAHDDVPTPGATAAPAAPGTAGPYAPAPSAALSALVRGLLLGGAALIGIGSLLPWAEVSAFFGTLEINGTDGDGVLTLVLAIALAVCSVLAIQRRGGRGLPIAALVLAALALVIAVVDIADVARLVDEADDAGIAAVEVSVGIGLWLVLLGSLAAVAGAVLALREALARDRSCSP